MDNSEEIKSIKFKKFMEVLGVLNIKKSLIFYTLLTSIIGTLGVLSVPLITQSFIDGLDITNISITIIIGFAIVIILSAVLLGVSYYLQATIGEIIVKQLREKLWVKLLNLPVEYYDNVKSGHLTSRLVNDTLQVKYLISSHMPQMFSGLISVIGSVVILFVLDSSMTFLMFIVAPVAVAIIIPLGNRMGKFSRKLQAETAIFTANTQETLSEIRLMKSSNAEEFEFNRGQKDMSRLYDTGLKVASIEAVLSPLMIVILLLAVMIILGYGGYRVANDTLSIGTLIAFLLYLLQIIQPLTLFATFFTEYKKALASTERINYILELEDEIDEGENKEVEFKSIQFKNVFFSYEDDNYVLRDISFDAKPNKKIAFVGPSGSGKTTIFSLILRFYDIDSGEITVDNINVKDIPLEDLRHNIGIVSQESPLISGTILDNIVYGMEKGSYTDKDIDRALERAYAKKFVSRLENGIYTEVGERGTRLSGGQKQRIAIARAFLRNPKLLLLDEATASLDSQSEKHVQDALDRLMEGRTVLLIAHRLSTIMNSDQIFFLENGKITGSGTHEELLKEHEMYQIFTKHQIK